MLSYTILALSEAISNILKSKFQIQPVIIIASFLFIVFNLVFELIHLRKKSASQ